MGSIAVIGEVDAVVQKVLEEFLRGGETKQLNTKVVNMVYLDRILPKLHKKAREKDPTKVDVDDERFKQGEKDGGINPLRGVHEFVGRVMTAEVFRALDGVCLLDALQIRAQESRFLDRDHGHRQADKPQSRKDAVRSKRAKRRIESTEDRPSQVADLSHRAQDCRCPSSLVTADQVCKQSTADGNT